LGVVRKIYIKLPGWPFPGDRGGGLELLNAHGFNLKDPRFQKGGRNKRRNKSASLGKRKGGVRAELLLTGKGRW